MAALPERITRMLFTLVDVDWTPNTLIADPVFWYRKGNSEIADHIVNRTMDRRSDWHYIYTLVPDDFQAWESNFMRHSDGGTRGVDCSAAGWYLEAVIVRNGDRHTIPVAMAGRYMSEPVSLCMAAAIALEEAFSYLVELIQQSRNKL